MLDMMTGAVRLRLYDLRKQSGLTQDQLAEKAKLHKQTISRLEGGQRQIEFETIAKLCDALRVTPNDLIEYSPDDRSEKS